MFCLVVLQSLKEESGCFLDTVTAQESFSGGLNVNERSTFGADETLGQVKSSLWVGGKELTQHSGIVHLESNAGGVWNNLVVLSALDHALNSLWMALSTKEDGQGHGGIHRHDKITKSLRALELVVLQPLLHELRASLLENRLGQLNTLLLVQLSSFQKRREVLEHRLWLTGLSRNLLESGDSRRSSQSTSRSSNELGSFRHISGSNQALKLGGV
mmetsp:Transcript_7410/g.12312  ORF Transcript_7410/g.12312 Transcript_7410/m.12312 type:complete len:215 (+) Transcript_7410:4031-4675(+)